MGQYGNPYTQSPVQSPYSPQTYGASPQSSFNTPQPYPYPTLPWQQSQPQTPAQQSQSQQMRQASPPSQQSREMMPPPPRPPIKEEKEEKLDLSDSLYGSGINLKDEENYHHAIYSNRHTQSDSFSTVQDSFGSNTMSPNNSFNMLTQATSFGSQDANGPLAGTLGQTRSQEEIELEVRKKRERAAIAQAERRQHHLNNQFLLCNNVRKRMDKLAREQGVRLSVTGLLIRQEETAVMTNGAGTEGIAAAGVGGQAKQEERPESMVTAGSPYEQIVSLISLASGERLRGLLEESFALARARRYGDHGRVPPDFADIAEGEGQPTAEDVVPQSITGTQWDRVPDTATPQRTNSFPNTSINATLRALAARDESAETARIKKREARRRAAASSTSGADTPADEVAPEVAPEAPKMTKKEQLKAAKESKSTEAALHQTTNQTAAMMTLGKKGKKYSWMTGGAAAMPTNRFAKPTASAAASGTATPVKREAGDGAAGAAGGVAEAKVETEKAKERKAPEWGDWREDGQDGKGIQARDWVLVLERDGKEKKALQRCFNRLGVQQAEGQGQP